jgi:SSS family solute:Na+ symporter
MILLSIFVGKGQKNKDDYYVGGRRLPWWAVGISTMATQTSAISFISIPAFVAVKKNGGLTWLQYELGVPIAMILVIIFFIPYFRKLKLISIYEYLELRFNKEVRFLISIVFLISRGFATGVGVFAIAIVFSTCFDLSLWLTIILIGAITIIYDTIGGIKAVVYSDVIQTIVLFGGIILCIYFCIKEVGSLKQIFLNFPKQRLNPLDFSSGFSQKSDMPLWAFLFGGIFLYVSYYGTDQSQVQRELSASSVQETKKSMVFNGIARFPLTLMYVFLGISLYSVILSVPELQSQLECQEPDYLVPYFILMLPAGIRGLLFASLLAAAMSSLDSALNSLSAITMQDFILKFRKKSTDELRISRIVTVCWGILITACAFFAGEIAETVIESINKVGSAFYGPILAAFAIGLVSKRNYKQYIFIGILSGVIFNVLLWILFPQVFWMWWNLSGFIVTTAVSEILYFFSEQKFFKTSYNLPLRNISIKQESKFIIILFTYFLIILGTLTCIYVLID